MEEFGEEGNDAFDIVTDGVSRLAVNVYNGKKVCEIKAGQLIKLIGKFKEMKNGKVQFDVYGLSGNNLPSASLGAIVTTPKRKLTSANHTPIPKVRLYL